MFFNFFRFYFVLNLNLIFMKTDRIIQIEKELTKLSKGSVVKKDDLIDYLKEKYHYSYSHANSIVTKFWKNIKK